MHNRCFKSVICGCLWTFSALTYAAGSASLTPRDIQDGLLPSGYDTIEFRLYDGNWTRNLHLPLQPQDQAKITIKTSASYTAYLDGQQLNIPVTELALPTNTSLTLVYEASQKRWRVTGAGVSYMSPNEQGPNIPADVAHIVVYNMADGNWVPKIGLPSRAKDGDLVVIRSQATWGSSIAPDAVLYPSTLTIRTGDEYVLQYKADFGRWVVDKSPVRELTARQATRQIPVPTAPRTRVRFADGNWQPSIALPAKAGDRDRVILSSDAALSVRIDPVGVNAHGPMRMTRGNEYEFLYVAEKGKWELVQSPITRYKASELVGGKVPGLTRPRTLVEFSDTRYVPRMLLPATQGPGTRLIVKTEAVKPITVVARGKTFPVINKGETVSFIVNALGQWERETVTIDLLLLYSDKAVAKFGEDTMRARLFESFSMTNEALENSGANFRVRLVGLRQFNSPAEWKTLGDALGKLRDDPVAQGWRNELKADGIYYEGTEEGCGLAWVRASAYNMVATGSTNCGTTVMRHEFGHNMSLNHGGESNSYNQGYSLMRTIMGGNAIPYYSTPNRYSADYGIPLGIENKIDAVRAMNEFSATVANYR